LRLKTIILKPNTYKFGTSINPDLSGVRIFQGLAYLIEWVRWIW